ncbi:MAG: AmmeMemoRadiSam system protein A [bacterium]
MITVENQKILLDVAEKSVSHGLSYPGALEVNLEEYPPELSELGACFVTLSRDGRQRGCIGTLVPRHALIMDVSENAYNAAFRDPRFTRLTPREAVGIEIEIAVLSQTEKIIHESEKDLLSQLRPRVDGLVLKHDSRRSTFLPSVWEAFPNPTVLMAHLKEKAGLPRDYWSADLHVERYTIHSFNNSINLNP